MIRIHRERGIFMKRFISFVLCLALTVSLALPASAALITQDLTKYFQSKTDAYDILGGSYSGAKKDGLPHGQGTITWENSSYCGNFKDGYPYGTGTFYYGDCTCVEGDDWDWVTEQCNSWVPERQGADMLYTGMTLEDVSCGYGLLDFEAGGTFEGEFYDGYPEGWGIYTYRNPSSSKNCTKESGEWLTVLEENRLKNIYSGLKIGKKWQGFGIGILKSGYCYCGEILNDYRDGYGELYTKKDALERGGIYRKGNIKETLIRG